MPGRMLLDQSLQPRQIIARERAALDADRFHCAHDLPQWPFRVQQKNVQTPGPREACLAGTCPLRYWV